MFRGYHAGRPYPRDTRKNQLSPSAMTLRISVMCWAHASLRRKATCELPAKTSLVFNCLESSHYLSHTTLTIKSHIKYRIQKIKHNYNKIWHGIKANTKIVVNHNFTIMAFKNNLYICLGL